MGVAKTEQSACPMEKRGLPLLYAIFNMVTALTNNILY